MYRAPVREVRFVLEELLGVGRLAAMPRARRLLRRAGAGGARGSRALCRERARAAEPTRRRPRGALDPGRGGHRARLPRGLPAVRRRRLARARRAAAVRRPARPARAGERGGGVLGLGQSRLQARPDADVRRRRMRSSCAARQRQKALFLPKMVRGEWTGTMVLTEPQAGSDLGAGAHARGARGRSLPPLRPEDLHHLGRSRSHQQHHPHGARRASRARRRESRASRCSSCRRCW